MIKNILFDLGKVLVDYDFDIFFQKLGYQPGKRQLIEAKNIVLQFDKAALSTGEFYKQMKQIFQHDLTKNEFEKTWCDIFTLKTRMVKLAKELSSDHKIYILSNTDELHFPYIWNKFSELHIFRENLMLSYHLQAIKPEKKIFQKAMHKFGLDPSECLFIDDKPENVTGAENYGIRSINHIDYEQTRAKIFEIIK